MNTLPSNTNTSTRRQAATNKPPTDSIILYVLVGEDANGFARRRIGRNFTAAEMAVVKRHVEHGMGDTWAEVMDLATEIAIEELGLTPEDGQP